MNREIISPDITSEAELQPATDIPTRNQLLESYLRQDDLVCREFLLQGATPADFEAVRLFFPYVRELSACRAPREWNSVANCLFFAYYAGHDLGCRHPELQEDILPGDEEREASRRLQLLHKYAQGERLNWRGLERALDAVAESSRPKDNSEDANSVVCSLLLKAARSGYAAATVAMTDPAISDLLDNNTGTLLGPRFPATFERALVAAPWRTHEVGWLALPSHPLPRLAQELYPEGSLEGKTIVGFLEEQLQKFAVKSEIDCPAGDLDLLDWVEASLAFGRRLKQEEPQLVAEIIKECAGQRLTDSQAVIGRAVAKAGKIEPLRLIHPLLDWYSQTHQAGEPSFYGQRLGRVGAIVDFAVWIPWVEAAEPKKRKVRAARATKKKSET